MKWKVGIGYTSKCNMNCKFCYSASYRNKKSNKIAYGKLLEFISFNKHKIKAINYGTGECTLEDTWWAFILEVQKINKGIKQGITTNGSLYITSLQNGRKEILKRSINDVDVSIDFADPKKHNSFRGHPNAFEWAIKSLKLCEELGIEKSIVMVATPQTFEIGNLKQMVELCHQYNANLRINIYRPINGIDDNPFIISCDQLFAGLAFLFEKMSVFSISDPLFSALLGEEKYKGDFTGKFSCRILDNGFITPSTYFVTKEWFSINIYSNPNYDLDDLRSTTPFRMLIDSKVPQLCLDCKFVIYCKGGAYDRRWLFHKSLDIPDPYCPFLYKEYNPLESIAISYTSKNNNSLVHDGYLPTIIFTPSEGGG